MIDNLKKIIYDIFMVYYFLKIICNTLYIGSYKLFLKNKINIDIIKN